MSFLDDEKQDSTNELEKDRENKRRRQGVRDGGKDEFLSDGEGGKQAEKNRNGEEISCTKIGTEWDS